MRPLPQHGATPEADPRVTLWYFAAAKLWLAVGALALFLLAPALARGGVLTPETIAATHLFSLGLVGSAIFGALHQFIPAVTGVGPRSCISAMIGFWLYEGGVTALVLGLGHWRPALQGLAWIVIFLGVGFAGWNTLPARRRALRNRDIALAVTLGHSALGMAMVLAAARIGTGLGWWSVPRESLLLAHLNWGIVGFGTITAVGFTSAMLPAFVEPRITPPRRIVPVVGLGSAGLVALTVGFLAGWPTATRLGAFAIALPLVRHGWFLISVLRQRTAPIDPGSALIILAVGCYLLGIGWGTALALGAGGSPVAVARYVVLTLGGWLGALILGVMHRVRPRILVLAQGRTGTGRAVAGSLPWTAVAAYGAGIACLAVGIGLGVPGLIRAGAGGLLLGTMS